MAKKIRRFFAVLVAVTMCTSMIPQALAAEIETNTTTEGGITTTVTTATETVADGNSTTVTVTVTTTKTGTDSEGFDVNYSETKVDTNIVVTNSNGTTVKDTSVTDGYETKTKDVETGNDLPDVSVELIPGASMSGTASETQTTVEGDTTTKDTIDRVITAETSDMKTTVNDTDSGLVDDAETVLRGPVPVYDEDDGLYINSKDGQPLDKVNGEHVGKEDVFDRNYLSIDSKYKDPSKWTDMPEDADFRYVGTGEHSKFFTARVTVVYKKENGQVVLDENNNPVIEKITKADGTPITVNGVPATELPDGVSLKPIFDDYNGSRPTTFMLMDKNGNKVYAYCCDMETGAQKGTYYKVTNLEDSDYYASEESEEHIRTIAMNGYWGTTDVPEEDGSYAMGSLEGIKAKLRAAITDGKMENETVSMTVKDSEGNETVVTKTMMELLDELTEGEALLATQSAIWSYSNGSIAVKNGKDGLVLVDPDGYKWNHDPSANSKDGEAMDDFGSARVDFLYNWLINLEDDSSSNVVINDRNFIDQTTLTVGNKVGEEEAVDENGETVTNGVYEAALNFSLAFIPTADDNLLMQLKYVDMNGEEVVVIKRLAAEDNGELPDDAIAPNGDGTYTIGGLKLSENKDFDFDIRLEGTQYLKNGVYVYQAVGGRDASQTMVGVAEGERNVDVSMGITVSFNVEESRAIVKEREWHEESDPVTEFTPVNPPRRPTPPTETEEIPEEDPPLAALSDDGEVILDEEVPLANVPKTGDNSVLWLFVSAAVVLGLVFVNLSNKKRTEA